MFALYAWHEKSVSVYCKQSI